MQQIILCVSSLQTSHIIHEKGISGLAYQSTLAKQSVVIKHIMDNNSVNSLASILEQTVHRKKRKRFEGSQMSLLIYSVAKQIRVYLRLITDIFSLNFSRTSNYRLSEFRIEGVSITTYL